MHTSRLPAPADVLIRGSPMLSYVSTAGSSNVEGVPVLGAVKLWLPWGAATAA